MVFENGVKSIQAAAYIGACTVDIMSNKLIYNFERVTKFEKNLVFDIT
jgi:hypothetical protein